MTLTVVQMCISMVTWASDQSGVVGFQSRVPAAVQWWTNKCVKLNSGAVLPQHLWQTSFLTHSLGASFPVSITFLATAATCWLADLETVWLWTSPGCVNNSQNQEWGHTSTTHHRTGWTGFHKNFLWLTPLIDFSLISVSDYAAGESCVCVQSGCVHIFSLHTLFPSIPTKTIFVLLCQITILTSIFKMSALFLKCARNVLQ